MPIKGEGAWKGQHWMQNPANKSKVEAMLKKMQRGARRARKLGTFKKRSKAEKVVVREIKKRKIKKVALPEDTILSLNGWRITLGHNSVKIEQS